MADVWNVDVASVDMNGNLAVDGTITSTGTITSGGFYSSTGALNILGGDAVLSEKVEVGGLTLSMDEIDGTGNVIDVTSKSFINMNGGDGVCSATIAAPAAGHVLVLYCSDANNNCTVTLTAGTFDGTNNVATFDAAGETLVLVGVSGLRYIIVENIGSVAFS